MKRLFLVITLISTTALANDWKTSPDNWNNSSNNWENSSSNWNNSPSNWDNSPSNYGNSRIIRDASGNPQGYAVPKSDGGVNFYDQNGTRKGYLPAR